MVGDEVGGVAHLLLEVTVLAGRSEGWVVVLTLVIQNMIVVESLRTAGHVPLAHNGSRIACPLQQFREEGLGRVDTLGKLALSVLVTVKTRHRARTAWSRESSPRKPR